MAFHASTVRQRREPDPVGVGLQLIPSAAVRIWYEKQMRAVVTAMIDDYDGQLERLFRIPEIRKFYGMDTAGVSNVLVLDAKKPQSLFEKLMNKLKNKWHDIFEGFAEATAKKFAEKVDQHSKTTAWHSLSAAGVKEPKISYNKNINRTLEAAIDFNHTLITGLQADAHEQIHSAIMLSLTSPNPEQQGQVGISTAVYKAGITSKKRIKLIANDQNSKMYSALNVDRMKQAGVDQFRWVHSSAGKVPRESHVKMDGEIFDLDDPRLWQTGGDFGLKKGDLGPPGWAINCRCRAVPII